MHFLPNCVRLVCIQNKANRGRPSVCTFSQSAAALYAYFLQTKRGGLVCALYARCGSGYGVRLVYALFLFSCLLPRCLPSICTFLRKKKKYIKKKGEKGALYVCILWKETDRPSVCTLCREKRSPAAGIARRRAERVSW